jgi:phosphoenolpyruvate-protein kinase (PTS system EI component)
VQGLIERDPKRSGSDKVLVLRQDEIGAISDPPGGLILVEAAPFSHPIIRWLGRGLPVALADADQANEWEPHAPVVLDTASGELRAWDALTIPEPWVPPSTPLLGESLRIADGTEICLCASVADESGVRRAVVNGAESIGLVRSEYLLPEDASRPTMDFFRHVFAELLTLAEPLSVTIRLLDLAADKWPAWLPQTSEGFSLRYLHGSQLYSFAAVRGVVDAQLAAMAEELGAADQLRLIWPSGGCLEDFVRWRDSARDLLPASVALGAMVESPLEILALGRWRDEADFLSVGCNDLLSHLCAADRDDPQQRHLLDPYRPELFRFLGSGAAAAGRKLENLQLCGLLPQIEGVLAILIGLGFRRFSGEPALIPLLARTVVGQGLKELEQLAARVCAAATSAEVRSLVHVHDYRTWGLVSDEAKSAGDNA